MGRPTKYKPEFVEQARKLCKLGATDSELADFFGVAVSSVALWKVEHPEFSDALKVGKLPADRRVVASLYRRAIGYVHDETDIRVVDGKIVKTEIRKHHPPDTTACIFWLKNRQRDQWRDRHTHEVGGEDGGPVKHKVEADVTFNVHDLTDDELAVFIRTGRLPD